MFKLHTNSPSQAALILFGVPKHFDLIWKAYMQNLVLQNPGTQFRIYFHYYEDLTSITNVKNAEIDIDVQSLEVIESILTGIDYTVITSNQSEFDKTINWLVDDHADKFEFTLETARNMFRQSNSLRLAYNEAAIHSPDVYIFARSDTFLADKLVLPKVADGEIYIPQWHGWPGIEVNDRFSVCSRGAAKIYARKGEAYEKYVKEKSYVHNPERMLRWWLIENNVTFWEMGDEIEHLWAPLLRVRGNGKVPARDASTFKAKNVEDLKKILLNT